MNILKSFESMSFNSAMLLDGQCTGMQRDIMQWPGIDSNSVWILKSHHKNKTIYLTSLGGIQNGAVTRNYNFDRLCGGHCALLSYIVGVYMKGWPRTLFFYCEDNVVPSRESYSIQLAAANLTIFLFF